MIRRLHLSASAWNLKGRTEVRLFIYPSDPQMGTIVLRLDSDEARALALEIEREIQSPREPKTDD